MMIITVPGGDVEALYAAVYDENGTPRDGVEISLEPGVFPLDPAKPYDGRLVLGRGSTLRGTLIMKVDLSGAPELGAEGGPVVLREGARIDGRALLRHRGVLGDGIIVAGEQGSVEQLWIDGGWMPGVEVTARGTISQVASTGHVAGFRVRAAGQEARATLCGNLAANNTVYGIGVIALDPDLGHAMGGGVDVRAVLQRNASAHNGIYNLYVNGGLGTGDSQVQVEASHNLFRGPAEIANIRAIGGFDYLAAGGAHHNRVSIALFDSLIADGPVGIRLEGGTLNHDRHADLTLPLERRTSSHNEVQLRLSNTRFQNNAPDIEAYGGLSVADPSRPPEAGGDHNRVSIDVEVGQAPPATIVAHHCYPGASFPRCTNLVVVRVSP